MTGADRTSGADEACRRRIEVSISIRTILLVAVAVAVVGAWALSSVGNVLLLIFVSVFNLAVLSPVVAAMERRLGWSRGRCATVLVLGMRALRHHARPGPGHR
jgi:predicted PurR-regulated permease PerM